MGQRTFLGRLVNFFSTFDTLSNTFCFTDFWVSVRNNLRISCIFHYSFARGRDFYSLEKYLFVLANTSLKSTTKSTCSHWLLTQKLLDFSFFRIILYSLGLLWWWTANFPIIQSTMTGVIMIKFRSCYPASSSIVVRTSELEPGGS